LKLAGRHCIRQRFDDTRVRDIRETVRAELAALSGSAIQPGQRVAIVVVDRIKSHPKAFEIDIDSAIG